MRFHPAAFPTSNRWQRTVALANREITHAVKGNHINLGEVVAILDAEDKCRAYLKARPTTAQVAAASGYDSGESASGGVGRTDAP